MALVTEHIDINYSLTFDSAFHFGTGLRHGLIHRTVARNNAEYLYVPGSTIKGVLRERSEQISRLFELKAIEPHDTEHEVRIREAKINDPDIIFRIFGSRFTPGQLYFENANLAAGDDPSTDYIDKRFFDGLKTHQVETRTQVSLSRRTRTAKSGHLYTSEYGIRRLRFEGQIYGYLRGFPLDGLEGGTYSLLLLLAGLLSIDRMGGNKSTGAGKVETTIKDGAIFVDGRTIPVETILEQLAYLEYFELEREEETA